jgi:hypothetical protein
MYTPISFTIRRLGFCCWLGLSISAAMADPKVVGKVSFSRGSNAAQQPGGTPRILGNDAEIFVGDNIQTTERSFVIIDFNDGAKVTVRPNSNFSVDQYGQQAAHPQAQLTLHEGGLQTHTGTLAKQNPDGLQIKTPLATVKAQEADYSLRICGKDCQEENKAVQDQAELTIVARIVDIKGQVSAKNLQAGGGAAERQLTLGSPLYSSDSVQSQANSYALMVFRDGEKITLQPSSTLRIAEYSYQRPGQPDHALFSLAVGGLRALTGSIGKTNKAAYAIDTPVGTIGIRGTGFDLSCIGSCVSASAADTDMDTISAGQVDGLYSHVWQGEIVVKNTQGEHVLTVPENGYIGGPNGGLWKLPELPATLPDNLTPRPDKDHSVVDKLFVKPSEAKVPTGLYVDVHGGRVNLEQNNARHLEVGKDQVAYAGSPERMAVLPKVQPFQEDDPYLEAGEQDNSDADMAGIPANSCDK